MSCVTTCTICGRLYEESSEEQANAPRRECRECYTKEHIMTKHTPATPLPWHLGVKQAEQIVYDPTGWAVANATVYHGHADNGEAKENARYIAHAANAYPKLVAALVSAKKFCSTPEQARIGRLLRELGEE